MIYCPGGNVSSILFISSRMSSMSDCLFCRVCLSIRTKKEAVIALKTSIIQYRGYPQAGRLTSDKYRVRSESPDDAAIPKKNENIKWYLGIGCLILFSFFLHLSQSRYRIPIRLSCFGNGKAIACMHAWALANWFGVCIPVLPYHLLVGVSIIVYDQVDLGIGKMAEKTCDGCKQIKPLIEFKPSIMSQDGYSKRCKECGSETNSSDANIDLKHLLAQVEFYNPSQEVWIFNQKWISMPEEMRLEKLTDAKKDVDGYLSNHPMIAKKRKEIAEIRERRKNKTESETYA